MFKPRVAKAVERLREAAAEAAWTQWGAIFTVAAARKRAHAIVDPEALMLLSFALSDHEPRLASVIRVMVYGESRLFSVQRAKNLMSLYPSTARERLGEFAHQAVAGGDVRWRSLASRAVPRRRPEREKHATPVLEGGPPLMLRLRLGLSVGIKPDVIAFLIGMAGGKATVQEIARAIAYHARAVRRGAEELSAAGFIEVRPTAPVSYRADLSRWAQLLGIDPRDPPAWRSWAAMYAFVAAVGEWGKKLPDSNYVLASEARDLLSKYGPMLEGVLRLPSVENLRGEAILNPFVEALDECTEWIQAVV